MRAEGESTGNREEGLLAARREKGEDFYPDGLLGLAERSERPFLRQMGNFVCFMLYAMPFTKEEGPGGPGPGPESPVGSRNGRRGEKNAFKSVRIYPRVVLPERPDPMLSRRSCAIPNPSACTWHPKLAEAPAKEMKLSGKSGEGILWKRSGSSSTKC